MANTGVQTDHQDSFRGLIMYNVLRVALVVVKYSENIVTLHVQPSADAVKAFWGLAQAGVALCQGAQGHTVQQHCMATRKECGTRCHASSTLLLKVLQLVFTQARFLGLRRSTSAAEISAV